MPRLLRSSVVAAVRSMALVQHVEQQLGSSRVRGCSVSTLYVAAMGDVMVGAIGPRRGCRGDGEAGTVDDQKYRLAQIAGALAVTYPDRPEMQMSHETLYKELYVQGRGELRRELTRCLRTGRTLRKPRKRAGGAESRGRIPGMVNISERPAEADDRAVPGHWEGDLIIGKDQGSQIGTLVERSTGYVRLLHLPNTRTADVVADAMISAIKELPATLRRTVTWDQGHELAQHARISIDAGQNLFLRPALHPGSGRARAHGLLRESSEGHGPSEHSRTLVYVADELNEGDTP